MGSACLEEKRQDYVLRQSTQQPKRIHKGEKVLFKTVKEAFAVDEIEWKYPMAGSHGNRNGRYGGHTPGYSK